MKYLARFPRYIAEYWSKFRSQKCTSLKRIRSEWNP